MNARQDEIERLARELQAEAEEEKARARKADQNQRGGVRARRLRGGEEAFACGNPRAVSGDG